MRYTLDDDNKIVNMIVNKVELKDAYGNNAMAANKALVLSKIENCMLVAQVEMGYFDEWKSQSWTIVQLAKA